MKKICITLLAIGLLFGFGNLKTAEAQSETFHEVYSTDSNGDVSFRYPTNSEFSHIWLYGNIPSWVCEPDPNNWDGWELTDYQPQYAGRKLLVPQRAQWYYLLVYGRSISDDLYLVTNP